MGNACLRLVIPVLMMLTGPLSRGAGLPAADRFFSAHCVECHDAEAKKGGLDLTALPWETGNAADVERWVKVFDRVERHEMPPADADALPDAATRADFLTSLRGKLHAASLARQQAEGRVVLRRLNRVEYENTLHDLLAVDLPLQHFLPEDAPSHGFDNVSEGLRLSMLHMEQYLEAADAAIAAALDFRARPEGVKRRFRYEDEESVTDDQKKGKDKTKSFRLVPGAVVIFDDNSPSALRQFSFRVRGKYRIRISSYAFQAAGRPVWLKLYATDWKTQRLLGYFDLPDGGKREVEVIADVEQGELLELKPYDTNYDEKGTGLYGHDAGTYPGRGVAIEWVDVEGPLLDCWPPPGVARLFGDLPVRPVESGKSDRRGPAFTVSPEEPLAAAGRVLQEFAARAFRRSVSAGETGRYVSLAKRELDSGRPFEEALRVAFRAILTSPRFLFLEERPGRLDDWALAARLSYFLWSRSPDAELRDLAARGALHEPDTLRRQVARLLDSPESAAFVENFTGQWLELRRIDFTQPDRKLYPEFDDILKASMLGETKAFFSELLRDDLSLTNFIHSDFLMLNRCLAEHYRIDGVTGEEIRRVPLPAGSHRGGVLTQASVLKVTANGTATSPVIRGAWVTRRLLGEPLAPPPPTVPAFEPDTRGATTIREQLAKHRSLTACASCHDRMDPPGFALENFDALGGWRERYRGEKGDAPPWKFRGRGVWEYKLGPAVDATGALPGGETFAGIDDFKRLLLKRQDEVVRNLTRNLLVYATGAGIQFADRAEVEKIMDRLAARKGGLRTLVQEIVQSDVFQTK